MTVASAHSLVGRLEERQAVATWLADVADARGGVLVITGEAGIGKSSLIDHLTRRAVAADISVAHGVGEAGSPIPYQAVAAWLGHLVATPPDGSAAPDVDLVRERLAATLGARLDPEAARSSQLALHLAVSGIVRSWLDQGPVVVVVDDGHWLDDASAALIEHLGLSLARATADAGCGLGVVVSTRPTDQQGPLSRLAHDVGTEVLELRSLDAPAVRQLVERRWGWRVPSSTAVLLADVSGGNPLSAITAVETSLRRGTIDVVDGELLVEHQAGLVTADIDTQIAGRLDELPGPCRVVAAWAAVLGDRPALADLEALAAPEDIDVEEALDELIDAGLLEDRGASARFPHPRVRAAILHDLGPRRRARLHAAISQLHIGAPDDRHLVAAAHHLELAGVLADRSRLATIAEEAGDVCAARFAWTEAARFLGAAVDARRAQGEEPGPTLLHRLAVAERLADDPDRCVGHAREAAAAYRARADLEGWGAAELLATREELACRTPGEVFAPFPAEALREWLAAAGEDLPGPRARALAVLAETHMAASEHDEGTRMAEEARRLAEAVDDHALLASIEYSSGLQELGGLELDAAEEHLRRAADQARLVPDDLLTLHSESRLALSRLITGRPARALADLVGTVHPDRSVGHQSERAFIAAIEASGCAALGRFAEAELLANESLERSLASGYAFAPVIAYPALLAARTLTGDLPGARSALAQWEGELGAPQRRWRSVIDVLAGGPEELDAVEGALRDRTSLRGRAPVRSMTWMWVIGCQAEVALAIGRQDLARDVLPDLRWLEDRGVALNPGWPFFVPRLLGAIEALAGDPESATVTLDRADRTARRMRLPLEALRVTLDRHRFGLLDDPLTAVGAAAQLDRMGLVSVVPDDLRRAEAPAGLRIVAFSDLVGSTALNAAVGDQRYAQLIDELTSLLRTGLRASGGVEFKHTGDGIAAWFTSVVAAIRWAEQANARLRQATAEHPGEALLLCVGITAGEPVDRSGDLFGLAVSLAARLCSEASPGEVLVSEEVRLLAASQGIAFAPVGPFALKGFSEAVTAHVVVDSG